MAGTAEGAVKTAAHRIGVTVDEWRERRDAGERWCSPCRSWHPAGDFGADRHRPDGVATTCLAARRARRPRKVRVGCPADPRAAQRAHDAVRWAIRRGDLAPIGERTCARCPAEAQHYHHRLGYEPEHHLDVQPLCVSCHQRDHWTIEVEDG